MSALRAAAAAARSVTSKCSTRAGAPIESSSASVASRAGDAARPWMTSAYPALARRNAIARPMPRLEPVTRMVSATGAARLRQKGADVARPVCLQRALGDLLAVRAKRAAVGGEVLFVAQGEVHLD